MFGNDYANITPEDNDALMAAIAQSEASFNGTYPADASYEEEYGKIAWAGGRSRNHKKKSRRKQRKSHIRKK